MHLSEYPFEIAPGSLEVGNPSAYVAKRPALFRDLLQFGRVALEVLPYVLKTPELMAAYPPLSAPTWDDVDESGNAIYTWRDPADRSTGLTHASEIAWFDAEKEFFHKRATVFEDTGKAITYLITRHTPSAQEDLRTNSDFAVLRLSNDFPKIFN